MTGWDPDRTAGRSARAVLVLTVLALVLLAALPLALLAAVIVMLLGHIVGGLALFGGAVLTAVLAVALAGVTGMHHLRKLISRASFGIVQPGRGQYADDSAEPDGSGYTDVVHLDRSDYTEVP
jgi:hypothetical protein